VTTCTPASCAALLNDAEVRGGLIQRGIGIPADTLFVAALHDTTTDAVTLYERMGFDTVRRFSAFVWEGFS